MRVAKPSKRWKTGAATALVALCGLGVVPAHAQGADTAAPAFVADNALGRFLLPYSPVIFDFAVQVGRSFAEITYGARAYDPVTETFTVSDLHIHRDAFDFAASRMRVGASTAQIQGFAVDLSELPLPPDVANGLEALGQKRLNGDAVLTLRSDDARAAYDLALDMDMPRVGRLSLAAAVDGFHILVPLDSGVYDETTGTAVSTPPTVAGTLRSLSFSYRDLGLVDAAAAIAAEGQGVSPDQMRAGLAAMPLLSVGALLDGLPGGASPGLREQANEWARAVGDFVGKKGEIRVTLRPAEPVALRRFASGVVDEALIAALNPAVSTAAEEARPGALAPSGASPLASAEALVSGVGALQDEEAGAAALLRLAGNGDEKAVRALSKRFGGGAPAPALGAEESAALYAFLLVGRALGEPVGDTQLGALGAALAPDAFRGAERRASDWFRANTAAGRALAAVEPATVAALRPAQLRALAFDAYDGRARPRDLTEAYALALVAAAGGDRLAEALRDDLARAARQKRLTLSAEEARARAAALWAAYSAGGAKTP